MVGSAPKGWGGMVLAAGGGLLEGWGGMVRLAALSRGMVMLLVCTTPATLSARFVGERDASWHYLAHL